MDMYCPKCDLKIAGESASECPICNTTLISEVEAGLAEFVPAEGLPKKGGGGDGSCDLEALLASSSEEIDFDPEALGLTRTSSGEELPKDEDISVLAEMWNSEDIDLELERVLGEAMSPVEMVETGSRPEKTTAPESGPEPEPAMPPQPEMQPGAAGFESQAAEEAASETVATGAAAIFAESAIPEKETTAKMVPEEEPPVMFETVGAPPEDRGHGPLIMIVIVLLVIGGAVGGYLYWAGQQHDNKSGKTTAAVLPTVAVKDQVKPVTPAPAVPENTVAARPARNAELSAAAQPVQATPLPEASKKVVKTVKPEAVKRVPKAAPQVKTKPVAKPVAKPAPKPAPVKAAVPAKKSPARVKKAPATARTPAVAKPLIVKKTMAPAVPTTGYVVHAGSFQNPEKAQAVAVRYRKAGFKKAHTVKVDLKAKGIWYRVLIPAGTSQAEAVKARLAFTHKFPGEPSRIIKAAK